MIDLFLRFDDVDSMLEALGPLLMTHMDDDGQVHVSPGGHEYAAWVVGEIPGRSGWHLNLRVISHSFDITPLTPFQVSPAQPYCRWA